MMMMMMKMVSLSVVSKFSRKFPLGTRVASRIAEKAPTTATSGSLLPSNGAHGEDRNPISEQNKRKDKSAARMPQDTHLIALIFFVSRFQTSYTSPRSRKSAPTVKETFEGTEARKGWIKISRYDNPRGTFALTSFSKQSRSQKPIANPAAFA